VSKAPDVDAAVATAVRRWDRIDVLVNNAGVAEEKPFLEIEDAGWDRVLDTNLRGAYLMAQRVARVQAARGGGSIIHIASIDASGGDGPYASYNASKAGLLGLNRTMALELGPLGIRVNCVSPGFTHTEMTEVGVPPGTMDYLAHRFDRVPLRRLVRPDEIAAACAFLASEDASAITGIDLTVDCGLTANWYILESIPADG
jgi:NAD(P)-dependent dehydrogenase (short-subunit alcohol dehydrogenase family)